MIEEFIPKLQKDLELEGPAVKDGDFSLQLENSTITISNAAAGFQLHTTLSDLPADLPELFYIKLLRGNFMHQASANATIGLNETATKIVLQFYSPQKCTYREFKERLEDFINLIDFWRAEIESHRAAPTAS